MLGFLVLAALALSGAQTACLAENGPFETKAKQALLMEDSTGTNLFEKSADDMFPPASLAKLMTAEYVFGEITDGRLSQDTQYKVSEYSWRTGGALSRTSTMFAALNSEIKVSDLLQGVVVQSANDGCMILAEGMAGSDAAFGQKLTARARELGLTKSGFANSSGLPDPGNTTNARELMQLARHIHATYPKFFPLFSQPDFLWNKIQQSNRVIKLNIGIDGMALGFSDGAGYSIVATMERNGTRLFAVLGGLSSAKERVEETRKIFDWGFANFARRTVFKKDDTVALAAVFGGDNSHVPLITHDNVDIFIPTDTAERVRARVHYTWPITAPIAANQKIGTLEVTLGTRKVLEKPVFAANAVATGSLTSKALDGLKELLFFWL